MVPFVASRPSPSWETLPNGALIARVDGYRLVVRRGMKGLFRFVLLVRPPRGRGTTCLASGSRDTVEQAMTAAEQVIATLPDRAF